MLMLVGLGNPAPITPPTATTSASWPWTQLSAATGSRRGARVSKAQWRKAISRARRAGPETRHVHELIGPVRGRSRALYKLAPGAVIVLYDELELAPGRLKVKQGGGSAGHNGIRSIDAHLGPEYWRVRLGIGHPGDKNRVHDYVLSDFPKAETED